MRKTQTDVVVLGGGTAGMGAFHNARLHIDNVYLIENNVFGTTCACVGCIPSKLLIAAAEARHHALHTDPFGVHLDKDSIVVNGEEVMQRVKSERDHSVGFIVSDVEEWPAGKRIVGTAKFVDEHAVQIDDHIQITAKSFVTATGSRPVVFPQWEALGDHLVVNDGVFSWDTSPKSVAMLDPGVIGLELGQASHHLGVKVEIFGVGGAIGGISDPVIAEETKAVFDKELVLHLDAKTGVRLDAEGNVEVRWEQDDEKSVSVAEYMLTAVGRRPNVDNIGLENLTIEKDARGVPVADPLTVQTSIPRIFIAGDASNQLPLLHEATDQGKVAGNNAGRYPNIGGGLRRSVIGVVLTNPQIASVGSKYAQVAVKYQPDEFVIGEVSPRNQGRSRVVLVNKGHMRLYAEKATGCFIGAEVVGPAAEHLAHLMAWVHQMKMAISQMLDMPFYHPVIEEGLRTALHDADAKLEQAWLLDEIKAT